MATPSHTRGATDVPLLEETIDENFRRTAERHSNREALVVRHQGIRWTYAELDHEIDRVARGLHALGLEVGDRVGLWSPNRFEWTLVQYATARLGIIMVCINPSYRTSELEFVLNQSGCRVLLAAPDFKTSDYRGMWESVAQRCPSIEHAIFFDTPEWEMLLVNGESLSADALLDRAGELDANQPINIQYTSGTTGLPKGATLTHRNILNNGFFVGEACGFREEDRVCIPVPFYHCFGMVMGNLGCTSHGACMVIPNDAFDPISVLEAVQAERCTTLYGVPTMFIAELAEPTFSEYNLSSLRTGIMAGSPCPIEVMKKVIEEMHMREVTIAYGMTETSPPRATLTHRNILNNGFFVGEACGFREEDRVCIPVPFYHCFGMVMGNLGCTSHGACMVIPNDAFDPISVLEAVQAERCTTLYGVPTMFIAELAEPTFSEYNLSSLRTGIMAGSPCPIEVMKKVIEEMHMREVTIAYGMTETSPVSTQTGANDAIEKRVGSVGRVHPHVEIRIVDPESGQIALRGAEGEFQTRGYSVMKGYWNEPEKTAEALDSEGWMHTGDLAIMDEDGYVEITGRIKDLIIRGGENVSPREIEEFLYSHPDVLDVQVVGVPDPRFGEAICAFVRTTSGEKLDAETLRAFCSGRIAHYKHPRYVITTSAFPMTVTGKIQKYKLREIAIDELGLATS